MGSEKYEIFEKCYKTHKQSNKDELMIYVIDN